MKIFRPFLLVFLCSYLPGILFANEQDRALSHLRTDLQHLKDKYDIPALAVIIVNTDKVLMADVSGLADRDTRKVANAQTIFRIGSITKMFTSLAMLMLEEDGLLNLEMNVHVLSPTIPLQNKWRDTHPVKIVHLLEHTAGLWDLSKAEFDHNTPLSLQQALHWKASSRITHWPPGMHYSYSNVGAGLAAYVIEKTSQQDYETFVEKRIFSPLGMSSASFTNDKPTLAHLATGYDTDAHTVIPYWHVLYNAFGAINIRPIDMVPFMQLLLNKGKHHEQRLLTEKSIMRMERPTSSLAAKSGLQFGYGLGNYTSQRGGLLFHGHGGDADGYLSRLAYNRNTGLAYFIVINTFKNNALLSIRYKIEDFISRNQITINVPAFETSVYNLRLLTGVYKRITERFPAPDGIKDELVVSVNDSKLLLKYENIVKILLPVTSSHFRYVDENMASSAFVTSENNQHYLQNADGNFLRISK